MEQRSRELGIRVALGASTGGVVREVPGEGVGLPVLGLAVGAALALPAVRLISDLLFGVGTMDPVTLALSGILLLAVALAACGLPALRAARTDPLTALPRE